ncbi:PIN domain-containing protein [Streptomyces sp. WMMB 322]|uniref:PIN domain-containing protein n=1 Tax=Streptomyces sp. WMMB 322 TaxID=1286821 RepID=UPI0006E2C42E|nr:PIN domain-containing protein [Streptomyces sp. WMMB 322]SCK35916.1 Predicted nucleic acid-binding protein, contains PIN domain [Streptomyces sp. WMMB 322]
MTDVVIADTNALYRLLDPRLAGHEEHRKALGRIRHLVVSPLVLGELDCLVSTRAGAHKAITALRFVDRYVATRRFEIAEIGPHMGTALAVLEGYRDADQGRGVGLADAMNVALAAAYRTDSIFTTDRHFRVMVPLTGHAAFRLLPEDM